jgi:hypothetical protein
MKSFYVSCSVMLTNLIVLFMGFNLALFICFQLAHAITHLLSHLSHNPIKPHSILDATLHPGWAEPEVAKLISESMATVRVTNYDYDEITQLRLQSLHGRYVNVDEGGFRRVLRQGPWPLDPSVLNVFVFGGSATFGFSMDDAHTIPSYLQEFASVGAHRRVNVYNFGRPGYTSTQELLLYLSLLRNGFVPNVSVFIDGLNDCQEWTTTPVVGLPWPDVYVYSAIEAEKNGIGYMLLQRSPIGGLARLISGALGLDRRNEIQSAPAEVQAFILKRWLKNKKAIEALSSAYGVKVAFVWQPVAAYKHDLRYDAFGRDSDLASEMYVPVVYRAVETIANRGLLGENFLNLAGIQLDKKENLYVDPWHYNEVFSGEIASQIHRFLHKRGMLE